MSSQRIPTLAEIKEMQAWTMLTITPAMFANLLYAARLLREPGLRKALEMVKLEYLPLCTVEQWEEINRHLAALADALKEPPDA